MAITSSSYLFFKKRIFHILLLRCDDSIGPFSTFWKKDVPDCLLQMHSLETLQLAGNGLRGDISKFNMPRVKVFSISGNKFRGELPSKMKSNSFEVFDISNNQITGYLDMNISSILTTSASVETNSGGTQYRANVNRLSGRLNLDSISTFDGVSVLGGNLFSCESLPSSDEGYNDYKCGSFNLELSLYVWVGVGVTIGILLSGILYLEIFTSYRLSLLDFYEVFTNESVFQSTTQSERMIDVGHVRQLLRTLRRLHYFAMILAGFILLMTIPVYLGFKFGGDGSYKVYAEQYANSISGLYLRTGDPAVALFVVYVCCYLLLTYGIFRLFVVEWSIMRNYVKYETGGNHTTENVSATRLMIYRFMKIVVVLMYLAVVFFVNAIYVKMKVDASDRTLILSEVGVFIFNSMCREFGIYYVVHYIFDGSDVLSSQASIVYSFLLLTTDFLIPAMATLATDDLCLGEYPETSREEVTSTYNWETCDAYVTNSISGNRVCVEYAEQTTTSTFTLPFIYSNHCRDALYRNYIPVIILSCVWNTFLSPILYWQITRSVERLSDVFCVCGLKLTSMRELVLPNLSVLMISICEDFCLLLLYGIVSPYCAFALCVGLLVRIFMTRGGILRYYKLQLLEEATDGRNAILKYEYKLGAENDINFKCGRARRNVVHVIWPGLFLSTYCFALFLFDMAHDNDDESLTVSYCMLISLVILAHATHAMYYHHKHRLHVDVLTRISSQVENGANNHDNRVMFMQQTEDGTLQSLKNPLLRGDELSPEPELSKEESVVVSIPGIMVS